MTCEKQCSHFAMLQSHIIMYDRYKPIVESIVNLVLSIIFINLCGLVGLLLATTVCTLFICSRVEPFVLYRHVFFEKFRDFIRSFFSYAAIVVADTIIGFTLFVLTTAGINAGVSMVLYNPTPDCGRHIVCTADD